MASANDSLLEVGRLEDFFFKNQSMKWGFEVQNVNGGGKAERGGILFSHTEYTTACWNMCISGNHSRV
jgi:hypothetical protein